MEKAAATLEAARYRKYAESGIDEAQVAQIDAAWADRLIARGMAYAGALKRGGAAAADETGSTAAGEVLDGADERPEPLSDARVCEGVMQDVRADYARSVKAVLDYALLSAAERARLEVSRWRGARARGMGWGGQGRDRVAAELARACATRARAPSGCS